MAEPANQNSEITELEIPETSRKLVESNTAKELVFGIVGHVGSGTSTIAENLGAIWKQHNSAKETQVSVVIKARKVIENWASQNSLSLPSDSSAKMEAVKIFQNLGDQMRSTVDHAAVARGLVLQIRRQRAEFQKVELKDDQPVTPDGEPRAYILDSLRHPAEVNLLRRVYGDAFVLLGVVCEEGVRAERIQKKYTDAGLDAANEFMRRDAKAPAKYGQRVSDAFHLSDYFIDNSESRVLEDDQSKPNPKWEIVEDLERLIRLVTHSKIERPRIEETAMHAAAGAGMRSACLSRQVGAAVLDSEGNLIATGTNEVPKAGGGVYGEASFQDQGEDPHERRDDRCFVTRKECSNTKEQIKISGELIDDLKGLLRESVSRNEVLEMLRNSRLGELLEFSRAVHAEMDALLEAGRKGVSTVGARVFVTTFPCHYCARHLISSGVDEVQYIEPYPKSKAVSLHGDSIVIGIGSKDVKRPSKGGNRVLFRPFTGVAPRMYRRAFQKNRRLKNTSTGDMDFYPSEWGSPYDISKLSYAEFEVNLTKGFPS